MRRFFLPGAAGGAFLLSSFLLGCGAASPATFDDFTDELFASAVSGSTINMHYTLSDPSAYGFDEVPISLGDASLSSSYDAIADLSATLDTLSSYKYEALSEVQQMTYDILYDNLSLTLSVSDLVCYDEPLRPSTGIQSSLPILYEEFRFYDADDVEDYLDMIALTGDYFDGIIAFEQHKAAEGLFMSDTACDTVISQCESFLAETDDHYLITTFDNKINRLPGISGSDAASFKNRNRTLVLDTVLPAYRKLILAMTKLLGSGKNDLGLCYYEDGTRYYEYLVAANTGSGMTVDMIDERIDAERDKCLAFTSSYSGEIDERISSATMSVGGIAAEAWSGSSDADASPDSEEIFDSSGTDAEMILSSLTQSMLSDFPAAPNVSYTVTEIDEAIRDFMAPAFYITAPIDDYGDHAIFINPATDPTSLSYFTTLAHEGFPGHLYQTVMSYEADLAPVRYVLNYPGYVEGWATYAEMISYGYAGLDTDTASYLAAAQSALLSLYASTDIGIHYSGWSYDDTCDFWADYGVTDDATLRDIYELIKAEPTHYLKYYVGYLHFLDLRETAEEMYGSYFDAVSFHDAVLSMGPAPFEILEKYLPSWYGRY